MIGIMSTFKPITKEGIPQALAKAERYRMLNEPRLSESICQDILDIEPGNQQAIINMLLAITDQIGKYRLDYSAKVRELITQLSNDYEKQYYSGIVCERQGLSFLEESFTVGLHTAYEWLSEAMDHYEKAEAIRPAGSDESILRWNTCARLIHDYQLRPRIEEMSEPPLE
jgi:hypothetical protein